MRYSNEWTVSSQQVCLLSVILSRAPKTIYSIGNIEQSKFQNSQDNHSHAEYSTGHCKKRLCSPLFCCTVLIIYYFIIIIYHYHYYTKVGYGHTNLTHL